MLKFIKLGQRLNFAQICAYLKWHGQGLFKKCIFIIYLEFFLQTFLLYNWILQIYNFFADSKSRVQELSNDVFFVIFGQLK